eukprot:5618678-Alexandrium_andersonii.AAC.1
MAPGQPHLRTHRPTNSRGGMGAGGPPSPGPRCAAASASPVPRGRRANGCRQERWRGTCCMGSGEHDR